MAKFEQIHVDWEIGETKGPKGEKIEDANVIKNKEGWRNEVKTEENLSKEKAQELSDKILEDSETKEQIKQLKELWEKYEKWELKDMQKKQYEDLMTTIRTELDKDVPTVIEMNKEININYYNAHPEKAAEEANNIVNNINNMRTVDLVGSVISHSEYLWKNSQEKLNTVISTVINNLDESTKSILETQPTEN